MGLGDRMRWIVRGLLIALAASLAGGVGSRASVAANAGWLGRPGAAVRVAYHAETGALRFIGADRAHPLASGQPAGLEPGAAGRERASRAFAAAYGPLFGLRDPASELLVSRNEAAGAGRGFVRFRQVHGGIPVLGGELVVQIDGGGNLISLNGEILPGLDLDTRPRIAAPTARQKALDAVAKAHGLAPAALSASQPELWIFNPALLGGPGPRISSLVWRSEVTAAAPIRELVLIDARTGGLALRFNQAAGARQRAVCDSGNLPDPDANPDTDCDEPAEHARAEGQAATGDADVDLAYDFSGITYDYFWDQFGRDSLDGAGMPLISVVKYCPGVNNCPFVNAFWNGRQMTYGAGFAAADDVVAHELTHGLTEFTAGLFYYYQSGAINESLSDVFGELIDLADGRGNDAPAVRWLVAEDLAEGPLRDMRDPGAFGDPDRTGSPDYWGRSTDNGGVHTNSGVNNKAAFLMVDGGTFNGRAVAGLGADKVGRIYYEALAHMLLSASDYQDLAAILPQACANLVGEHGIVAADCQEVRAAVKATEMHLTPVNAPTAAAALCPGDLDQTVFFDDLEDPASGNWVAAATAGALNEWYYPAADTPYGSYVYARSGVNNLWGRNSGEVADFNIAMTRSVRVPKQGRLHFAHAYGFEIGVDPYDGGVVEYSLDEGQSWLDAGPLFTAGGYSGTLWTGGGNPLGGRAAFVGRSHGYGASRADLDALAGRDVRFRFRIGTDRNIAEMGWFIDDIRIYACAPLPVAAYLPALSR